jgi:CDP-diacylglycerol--glycerol-3-phosphate 3-phosphatidyltransferase
VKTSGFLAAASSVRIVLVPVIMALVAMDDRDVGTLSIVAGALFAVAAITDFFDGYLARRWNVTTTLGSFLDTTADKLLVTGVLVALVAVERVSPWIATIIIGRELVIMGLRGVVAADGLVMAPSMWGKVKTNVQFFAILVAIVRPDVVVAGVYADEWLMVAAAVITVGSAVDYLVSFSSALRASAAEDGQPEEPQIPEAPETTVAPAASRLSAQPTLHSHP